MKKLIWFMALMLALCPVLALAEDGANDNLPLEGYIIIMHTGNLSMAQGSALRMDQVEEARQRFLQEGAQVLLLDTGNAFGMPALDTADDAATEPTAEPTDDTPADAADSAAAPTVTDEERTLLQAMTNAGYDAMAPGAWDFALGQAHLMAIRDVAGFPFLCANATDESGTRLMAGSIITMKDEVQIGLFGLTASTDVEGVAVTDPVESAQATASALRSEGCALVIALCSLGATDEGESAAVALANQVEGLDIVIDTSSGALESGLWLDNGTLVTAGGDALSNIGVIAIDPTGNCACFVVDNHWM